MTRRLALVAVGLVALAASLAGCAFDSGGYHVVITPTSSTAPAPRTSLCVAPEGCDFAGKHYAFMEPVPY